MGHVPHVGDPAPSAVVDGPVNRGCCNWSFAVRLAASGVLAAFARASLPVRPVHEPPRPSADPPGRLSSARRAQMSLSPSERPCPTGDARSPGSRRAPALVAPCLYRCRSGAASQGRRSGAVAALRSLHNRVDVRERPSLGVFAVRPCRQYFHGRSLCCRAVIDAGSKTLHGFGARNHGLFIPISGGSDGTADASANRGAVQQSASGGQQRRWGVRLCEKHRVRLGLRVPHRDIFGVA